MFCGILRKLYHILFSESNPQKLYHNTDFERNSVSPTFDLILFFFSKLNRTDHTKLAKCCEVVHCDRLEDESYYSRDVRDVREVFSLKTAVHFNAEAQGRKVTQRKRGLL